jgi:hypothetical protein
MESRMGRRSTPRPSRGSVRTLPSSERKVELCPPVPHPPAAPFEVRNHMENLQINRFLSGSYVERAFLYAGVSFRTSNQKFVAKVGDVWLGSTFTDEEAAARAYDK